MKRGHRAYRLLLHGRRRWLPFGVPVRRPRQIVSNCRGRQPHEQKIAQYGNPSSDVVFGKRYYVLDNADGFVERGRRFLVRHQVSRPQDLERRGVQHARDDRGAQKPAAADLCARQEPRQRAHRGGQGQRSRSVHRRPHHRSVVRGREETRGQGPRHRQRRDQRNRKGAGTRPTSVVRTIPLAESAGKGRAAVYSNGFFSSQANAATWCRI